MPDPTTVPVPAPATTPWYRWAIDNPKRAIQLAFVALAVLGLDQWFAARLADLRDRVRDATDRAAQNGKAVDDLIHDVTDMKFLVGCVKANQESAPMLMAKPAGCGCDTLCPCKK